MPMNKYISIIFKHWQTTGLGLLIGSFTGSFIRGASTVDEWVMAMGGIGTVAGLIMKDPNKTQSKD